MKQPTQDDLRKLVDREVILCVSSLVYTLAQGYGTGALWIGDKHVVAGLPDLCEQAAELSAPVDDYEEAAIQAGWALHKCDDGTFDAIEPEESSPTLHNLSAETAW